MLRITLVAIATLLLLASLGCGGTTQVGLTGAPQLTGQHLVVNPDPTPGEDFGFNDNNDKAASAAYNYYFEDSVNQHSTGRWDVQSNATGKHWILSNVFYTDPKAWQMGGNYWNNENDALTSHPGIVPPTRRGIKVGFHGRWRIAPGDGCSVQYSIDGGPFTEIAFFSGGQNPSFPGWDRYTLALPDSGPAPQQYRVRFAFNSDGGMTDMGFGVDRFAIYQTRLAVPLNLDASDENQDAVTVGWNHNFDGERPANYDVYRSDSEFGTYSVVGSTPYPGTMLSTSYDDSSGNPFTEYWYKVRATKVGWDDSDFSNADFGTYWIPGN